MADPERPRLAGPVLIELGDVAPPAPEAAPPVPDADAPPPGLFAPLPRGSAAGRLLLWAAAGFVVLAAAVAAFDFVAGLVARNLPLAVLAGGLAGVALLAALALGLGEWRAWRRLGAVEELRAAAEAAALGGDLAAARAAVGRVRALYARRPEMAVALERHAGRAGEVLDADAALVLAEEMLMPALDAEARRAVEAAARQVAAVTALVPLALVDVVAALVANLRMIRRIAEIYGGRAGSFGSWRLMRRVIGHLAATGAIAIGDDLVSSVAGGGLVARVSRRFGEGVVNGALTARVGIAAIEVCRPLPFRAAAPPRVPALVGRALAGLFGPAGGPEGVQEAGPAGGEGRG
jgi:putative membrane protein